MRIPGFIRILIVAGLTACGGGGGSTSTDSGTNGDSGPQTDGGIDAGSDAGVDAGIDAGGDAGADAGGDAGFDGGTDAGPTITPLSTVIPFYEIRDVALTAGEARQDTFTFELPAILGLVTSLSVDLEDTLSHVHVMRNDGGASEDTPTLEIAIRIAPGADIDTVCTTGELIGPATATGDSDFALLSVDPTSASASDAVLTAVNSGSTAVCVETTSNIDAILTLDGVSVALGLDLSCDAAEDLSGTWSGSDTCVFDCGGGTPEATFTITQAGHTASYESDEAYFVGTVCGDEFYFSGGSMNYQEVGTLTLSSDTEASRMVDFTGINGSSCTTSCTDTYTRE